MLAGRLSDKMSSELGYYRNVVAELCFFIGNECESHIIKEVMRMIETERLILRPFYESDAEDLFAYLKEPLVNCFACMKLNTMEEAKEETKRRTKDTEYCFAIVLKETGKVIGEIEAHPESHAPDESMHTPKIIMCRVRSFARNWACVVREHSWSSFLLSMMKTFIRLSR